MNVANFPAAALEHAAALRPLACAQFGFSLVDRMAEHDVLPTCARLGMSAVVYGTLGQGLLTGKFTRESRFDPSDRRHRLPHLAPNAIDARTPLLERLRQAAARHHTVPAVVAVRWALDDVRVDAAIVGAKSPAQVDQNSAIFGWHLTEVERQEIASASS